MTYLLQFDRFAFIWINTDRTNALFDLVMPWITHCDDPNICINMLQRKQRGDYLEAIRANQPGTPGPDLISSSWIQGVYFNSRGLISLITALALSEA